MIRGFEVSYNTSEDPETYDLTNTIGWITVELPDGYTPGDPISLLVDGGVYSSGTFPDDFDVTLGASLVTVDGAGIDEASYSGSGQSWAPGSVWSVRPTNAGVWNTEGVGAQKTLSTNDLSHCGYTLIDNGTGEGAVNIPPLTVFGWSPSVRTTDNGTGTPLNPGDRVSFQIYAQTFSYDDGNPTRGVYPGITALQLVAGDTVELDLADVYVGFNTGSGDWNAGRFVENEEPAVAADAQDWFSTEEDPEEPVTVDVSAALNGSGYVTITVRSFECQLDSETTWECVTPEADAWECATAEDDGWVCVGDLPAVGYGLLLDVNGGYLTYVNGGRIKLI